VSAAHTVLQRGPNILVNRDWTQETGAQQNSPNILPGNARFNNTISLHKTASPSNLVICRTYTLRNICTSKAPRCVVHTHAYMGCAQTYNAPYGHTFTAQAHTPPKHTLSVQAK